MHRVRARFLGIWGCLLLAACGSGEDPPCEGEDCTPCEGEDCTPCEGDDCTPCEGDDCTPIERPFEGCAVVPAPELVTVSAANCSEAWDDALQPGDVFRSTLIPNAGMSASSPRAFDVNNDGCADILTGTGSSPTSPLVAIDGRSNQILWQRQEAAEIFGSPLPMRGIDNSLQILVAGREGVFLALNPTNGREIWRADVSCFRTAEHANAKNFYNPIVVEDLTGDGVGEVVVVYGGDHEIPAYEDRPSSFVLLIDGASGAVLGSRETPDLAESYTSITRVDAPSCDEDSAPQSTFVIGTGGETHQGELFLVSVQDLMTHDWCAGVGETEPWGERIAAGDNQRGFIAPPTRVDVTGDGVGELFAASTGGGMFAIDGASFETLWHRTFPGEESTSSPAIARQSDGTRVSGWGSVIGEYPNYTQAALRAIDANTGDILDTQLSDDTYVSSVLAADLDGDGNDELIFTVGSTFSDTTSSVVILDVARGVWERRPLPVVAFGTPLIRRYSTGLELIAVGRDLSQPVREVHLVRTLLSRQGPSDLAWPEYLGDCHDSNAGCVEEWHCTGDACNAPADLDADSLCLTQWRAHMSSGDVWFRRTAPLAQGTGRALSAPRAVDVNGDGCRDFVFGVGWEDGDVSTGDPAFGDVIAIDAVTSDQLWNVRTRGEVFGSAVELRDATGELLLLFGGRDGTLVAIEAFSGTPRWYFDASCFVTGDLHYGIYNPLVIEDINADGVEDLLVLHGGDPVFGPGEVRPHSYVLLVSGADGALLAARPTPDGAETYNSPAMVRRAPVHTPGASGSRFVFGTGGETRPGSVFLGAVSDLLGYNACENAEDDVATSWGVELATRNTDKGVIAPPIVVDTNGDGILDIVAQYFDGVVAVIPGQIGGGFGTPTFQKPDVFTTLESNHAPAFFKDAAGAAHLALAHNEGVFPMYFNSYFHIFTGGLRELSLEMRSGYGFSAGPIAGDINNDGSDEAIFAATRMNSLGHATALFFAGPSSPTTVVEIPGQSVGASPLIFRAEGHTRGELVFVGFFYDLDGNIRWQFQRHSLNSDISATPIWPQYQGPCGNGQARCF